MLVKLRIAVNLTNILRATFKQIGRLNRPLGSISQMFYMRSFYALKSQKRKKALMTWLLFLLFRDLSV